MLGEVFELPVADESYEPKLLRVKVVPGQSPVSWGEVLRVYIKVPGGIGRVETEVMNDDEAADFQGLVSYEVLDCTADSTES